VRAKKIQSIAFSQRMSVEVNEMNEMNEWAFHQLFDERMDPLNDVNIVWHLLIFFACIIGSEI
jgi:hypothetical protein